MTAAESWNDAVIVWNGLVAGVPALVVRPESRDELAAAVAFAREHGLRLGIARGPIDAGAGSVAERRVTLDLSEEIPPSPAETRLERIRKIDRQRALDSRS